MLPLPPQRPGQPPSPADTPSGVHRRHEVDAGGHTAPPLLCLLRQAVLPLLRLCVDNNRYNAAAVPVPDGSRARDGQSTSEFTNIVPAPARGGRYSAVLYIHYCTVQLVTCGYQLMLCTAALLHCTVLIQCTVFGHTRSRRGPTLTVDSFHH